jgi:hypothetical protein
MIGGGALLTEDIGARAASLGLMAFGLVVSALTDCRISLAKIIPVEVHETFDYLLGSAIIAMPFVVG